MAIEHSEALAALENFAASFENKLIDFPGADQPVYARPVSVEEIDALNKYTGNDYNVRLIVVAAVDAAGKKLFREEDIPSMRRLPAGLVAAPATQISMHIFSNFDAVKNS